MTIQEIAQEAAKSVNAGARTVQFKMAIKGQQPEKIRLAGRRSPMGDVLGYIGTKDGVPCMTVNFSAIDVLAWAIANGAQVEIREGRPS